MIKNISLLFLFSLLALSMSAQSILLERDLNESVYVKKKGPNKNHFLHLYYDHTNYTPENDDIYDYPHSFRDFIGIRNYYRLADSYIMGFNFEFGWERFGIKQSSQKTFPSTGTHKKEFLSTTNLGLEYFNRILITQREGSLGLWVDAGAYGNLTLSSRQVTKDKLASAESAKYHKEVYKRLEYVNPWEYGVKARIGYKRYAIVGTYRFSDWISTSTIDVEPPRLSLGVELGIY
ncbi:MAG TPA: hypothetical protein VHO90_18335 [Bacteroidales bacterium]|nr:hypothetical protein [Bacteroidales bacterium]